MSPIMKSQKLALLCKLPFLVTVASGPSLDRGTLTHQLLYLTEGITHSCVNIGLGSAVTCCCSNKLCFCRCLDLSLGRGFDVMEDPIVI